MKKNNIKKISVSFIIIMIIVFIFAIYKINSITSEKSIYNSQIEYKEVKLNEYNCDYSLNEDTSTIKIKEYAGGEDCIIIPKEIDDNKVEKVETEAFKDNYNLETIKMPKEVSQKTKEIKDFKVNTEASNEEYVVYETTREYSDAYKEYLNLSEEERLKVEVIPDKYDVPIENLYTEEMKELYTPTEAKEDEIPSKYDLRDYIDIKVENQNPHGTCYAYATMSSIETNLSLLKNETIDLSEIQYAVMTGQGRRRMVPASK